MAIIVSFKENRPGYADLEIKLWKGEADIEIAVVRNQDGKYFSQGNQWNTEPVWHRIPDIREQGNVLQGSVGPWLVDALVEEVGNTQFLFLARSGGFSDKGVIRFIGNVMASSANGSNLRGDEIRDVPQMVEAEMPTMPQRAEEIEEIPANTEESSEMTETEVEATASVINDTASTAESHKKNPLVWILPLVLLLIGLGVFWFLNQEQSEESIAPESIVASAPAVSDCSIDASKDELSFIQACLKTNPDDTQILNIINQAKAAQACGVAQRLYANKANNNAKIAFAYAKEYDEAFSKGNSCFKLDKETAIYWYETGLEADPTNTEAQKRLEELKK